jgi:hypothetical protein
MTTEAMGRTPALNGSRTRPDSSQDANPLRAIEVEALVWSTMTIAPYATRRRPLAAGVPDEDPSSPGGRTALTIDSRSAI